MFSHKGARGLFWVWTFFELSIESAFSEQVKQYFPYKNLITLRVSAFFLCSEVIVSDWQESDVKLQKKNEARR